MRVTKVKKFQLPFNSRLVNGDKQTTPISVNISKVDICLATLTETNQRDNACTNLPNRKPNVNLFKIDF